MMPILWIIGKEGMLGRAFCRILADKKIPFVATSKKECDVTSLGSLEQAAHHLTYTHMINCSAYTAVDLAEKEPLKARSVNELGVKNLALTAQAHKKKLIHFSTDSVFDGKDQQDYSEENSCNPLSVYGETKRKGEVVMQSIHPLGLIIRISWMFGKEGEHFVSKMVQLMREKKILKVVADQWGRPTYAEDVVLATLKLLDKEGIYHFANREKTSRYLFAKAIYQKVLSQIKDVKCEQIIPMTSEEYHSLATRPFHAVLSTKKVELMLKESPRTWKEALDDYFQGRIC